MSYCTVAMSAMKKVVIAPITSTNDSAAGDCWNNGDMRATMKMPAVTIVAACINAEIGVGPSIESGNHTCNGNCADFPIAPINSRMQITVSNDHACPGKISIVLAASVPAFALSNTVA